MLSDFSFDDFARCFSPWNPDCWRELHARISTHQITVDAAHRQLGISENTIRQHFRDLGLELNLTRGRPALCERQEIFGRLMQLRSQQGILCGYKHAAEAIVKEGERPAYRMVQSIFQENGWMNPRKIKKIPEHLHRFEAKFVDYCWHTDLHELIGEEDSERQYLIAFLDDLSRFIIHWKILPDKTMRSCSEALREALQSGLRPAIMTSDNGGEFIGHDFAHLLQSVNIQPFHTKPRTPQQNGKMERFWRTVDNARGNDRSERVIGQIIHLYNYKWRCNPISSTPAAFRESHMSWMSDEAVIHTNVHKNLIWNEDVTAAEKARMPRWSPDHSHSRVLPEAEIHPPHGYPEWTLVTFPPVFVPFGEEDDAPDRE